MFVGYSRKINAMMMITVDLRILGATDNKRQLT